MDIFHLVDTKTDEKHLLLNCNRQYSGFKTEYAKRMNEDDVKICGNFSVDQIQNAFQNLKDSKDNIGVYGLLMRQVRLGVLFRSAVASL